MSIDEVYKIPALNKENLPDLQKILGSIHEQSTGIVYATSTGVTADMVPFGKLYIVDDGTNKRIYMRTGEDNVGYINLT